MNEVSSVRFAAPSGDLLHVFYYPLSHRLPIRVHLYKIHPDILHMI